MKNFRAAIEGAAGMTAVFSVVYFSTFIQGRICFPHSPTTVVLVRGLAILHRRPLKQRKHVSSRVSVNITVQESRFLPCGKRLTKKKDN